MSISARFSSFIVPILYAVMKSSAISQAINTIISPPTERVNPESAPNTHAQRYCFFRVKYITAALSIMNSASLIGAVRKNAAGNTNMYFTALSAASRSMSSAAASYTNTAPTADAAADTTIADISELLNIRLNSHMAHG